LVSLTVCAAPVVPTSWLAKLNANGDTVTGAEPVPLRLTVCGLLAALSVNVSVPLRVPSVVGEKVTLIEHVAPAAMLAPQLLPAMAKSPVVVMLEKLRLLALWFVRETDLALLVFPTANVPKLKEVVERATGAAAYAYAAKPATQRQTTKPIPRTTLGLSLLRLSINFHE
jgi:hypothetical protein